jgi:hypothetical protein
VSDQVPTPDELGEIRKWALAYSAAERRTIAAAWTPDLSGARAGEVQARASLKAVMMNSGACCPIGWPEGVTKVLTDLSRIFGGNLGSPLPSHFPDLEERIKKHLIPPAPTKQKKKTKERGRPSTVPADIKKAIEEEYTNGETDRYNIASKVQARLNKLVKVDDVERVRVAIAMRKSRAKT